MSEKKLREDGGAAFPQGLTYQINESFTPTTFEGGMTLRDYFAARASEEDIVSAARRCMNERKTDLCSREEARYFHADAMIAERNK